MRQVLNEISHEFHLNSAGKGVLKIALQWMCKKFNTRRLMTSTGAWAREERELEIRAY